VNKIELITYINENTTRKISGRKELTSNDIFISGKQQGDSGFRVSAFGRDVISKHFKAYKLVIKSETFIGTGNQILALDKYINSPYYLKKSKLVLFEEVIAAELLMIDGDIDLWVQNKTYYTSKT
jgi:hypothetical protein|tara:strand:- start:208 stop:582 length:375 start_codon:yes stop_codon:yes gene_type:complete